MNLIEAIKSGKPYRCLNSHWSHKDWREPKDGCHTEFLTLALPEILSDNWEIQESAITITRTQFLEAARRTWGTDRGIDLDITLKLARQLGLDEP